jgi:hypothetical protein
VIQVTDLDLGQRAADVEAAAADGPPEFLHFQPLIIDIERDIRVYLELPFPRTVADELRKIITLFVEFSAGDLSREPGAARRPVTVPIKLKQLQKTGEDILVDLGPYARLADHYFDEEVELARKSRGSDSVDKEIDAITVKAKKLRDKILAYLNELSRAIRETSAQNES